MGNKKENATIVFAIDPGTRESGIVLYDATNKVILNKGILWNSALLESIKEKLITFPPNTHAAIEMVASYGMPVGKDVFETVFWIGRFYEALVSQNIPVDLIYRRDVKLALCNSPRAKDANIRQAIIDMFPASGGGKIPQVGIKSNPGPLYGIKKHEWSALAVALTYVITM